MISRFVSLSQCGLLLSRKFSFTANRASQTTIRNAVNFSGTTLHAGTPSTITVCPAHADTGIVFRMLYHGSRVKIPATWQNVVDTRLCTVLGSSHGASSSLRSPQVSTVEHLMAALSALDLDNVEIDISGTEVPVLDGSSIVFYNMLKDQVVNIQNSRKKYVRVSKPIRVESDDHESIVGLNPLNQEDNLPLGSLILTVEVDFGNRIPALKHDQGPGIVQTTQRISVSRGEMGGILDARTFGFLEEVEYLRSMGRALGGSLENAVVFKDGKPLNVEGLRYEDEPVRHKALDVFGDLRLGGWIMGEYYGVRPSHALNHKLLVNLFQSDKFYETIE